MKERRITFLGNFQIPYTSENDYLWTMRQKLGFNVIPLQEREASGDLILKEASNSDYFFWVHTHGWDNPGIPMRRVLKEIKNSGTITFSYHLDLWLGIEREKDLETDPYWDIDYFFSVDPQMVELLNSRDDMPEAHYIRPGVNERDCKMLDVRNRKDIIFVGSYEYHKEWQYRKDLINWLGKNYTGFELYGQNGKGVVRGEKLNRLYADTKIVIGDSLCKDFCYPGYWSDRVYETLGRGGFLIHPYIEGLEEEFEDGKHLVFYKFGDFDDLKKKIDYYLENDKEREKIRKNGHNLVKKNYTYTHRLKNIFDILESKPRPERTEINPKEDILKKISELRTYEDVYTNNLVRKKDVIKIIEEELNWK